MTSAIETKPEIATTPTQRMTGGEAVVATLQRNGVDTIFALPGVQLDGLFSALYDHRDTIRVLHTRHEQATAYMADGYARVSGKEGVCLVVPGPGLLNATAALSTAYACNSPVLCLTGQIRSDLIDFGRGLLHEIPDQLGMIGSVTKHAHRAMSPGEIPGALNESFRQLRTGRPRPVEFEVPPDIFVTSDEVVLAEPAAQRERFSGDPDLIEQAARLLGGAKSPLIYAGGGVNRSDANENLLRLAEMLQAPVIISSNGRGAISDRHYLAHNVMADRELRPRADVILTVGTRFIDFTSQGRPLVEGQKLIQLDIDPVEIGRNQPPTIGIVADAQAALAALAEAMTRHNRSRPSRKEESETLQMAVRQQVDSLQPQASFGHAIRAELPDEGIVVSEMTQVGYWATFGGYPVYAPNTFITAGYQGTLGYGFPTAMGVKVGNPNVPVVSINGDGGFGFALNELATVVQHNIPLVTIVFNDSAYGNVRRIQQEDLGGKVMASDLKNPDYLKLADAFGLAGYRVDTPAALGLALKEAINRGEPALIEAPVGAMPNPWRMLALR